MPRKHIDGYWLNDRGERDGRWDDNAIGIREKALETNRDPDEAVREWRAAFRAEHGGPGDAIVERVEGYYMANRWRADRNHGMNWLRVLNAFGQYQERGLKPFSAAEAWEEAKKWSGWKEIAKRLEKLESTNYRFAHGYAPRASGYAEDDGYMAPDDHRWGNPRQAEAAPDPNAAYKAEQDAYAEEVEIFQAARDAGEPDAQQGFDEWKRLQSPNGALFPFNGTYVEDARTGCYIAADQVARRRDELTAENVRYRLSRHPDGMVQISWLALNYEGCLCLLPESTETETRMVPAEEVPDLIWAGNRVLTHKVYSKNQHALGARDDRFTAFKLWVQYSPAGKPLGVCPTQGDSSDGKWKHNEELFVRLHGHAVEEVAPVDAPTEIANAILAGDWAEVARLAQERAGS